MTIETVEIICEALAYYGKQKAKELEEAREARKPIPENGVQHEIDLEAFSKEMTARDELQKIVKALAEFKSIKVKLVKEKERDKPFWKRW